MSKQPGPDLKAFAADPLAFFSELVIPAAGGPARFADCMAPHQRDWFAALAPSLLALAAGKAPPCGRFWSERTKGGSKDTDAACALLWLLAFTRRKLDMQAGASDRDQAGELKKAAADVLRLNPWLAARVEVQAWSLLCKPTGSELTIIASDVASSHGARPDVVLLNELSHVGKEEFAQNLLDNASKKPQGLVIICTNAGFQGSWQHNWRETFRRSERWHFHAFSEPAPWLSEAEIEEARRRNSRARFARLFLGEWVSAAGDALDEQIIAAAVKPDLRPQSGALAGWSYTLGVDIGIVRNWAALVCVGVKRAHAGHATIRLAQTRTWKPAPGRRVDIGEIEQAILDLDQRFDLKQINVDAYEARYLISRLAAGGAARVGAAPAFGQRRRESLPVVEVAPSGKSLTAMASAILEAFNDLRIELFDCPELLRDVRAFQLEEKSYGWRLTSPQQADGSHGDLGYALALAVMAASELASRKLVRVGVVSEGGADEEYRAAIRQAHASIAQFQADQDEWLRERRDHSLGGALRAGVVVTDLTGQRRFR